MPLPYVGAGSDSCNIADAIPDPMMGKSLCRWRLIRVEFSGGMASGLRIHIDWKSWLRIHRFEMIIMIMMMMMMVMMMGDDSDGDDDDDDEDDDEDDDDGDDDGDDDDDDDDGDDDGEADDDDGDEFCF